MTTSVTISGREARLRLRHAGVTDRQARLVLAAGLAGVPTKSAAQHLYAEDQVDALVARPVLTPDRLQVVCPTGWFVSRRVPSPIDASIATPAEESLRTLETGWEEISIWTKIALRIHLEAHGPLPFLATVAGFVRLGADLLDCGPGARLTLTPPGAWFESMRESRVPTGPGRPWHIRLVRPEQVHSPAA